MKFSLKKKQIVCCKGQAHVKQRMCSQSKLFSLTVTLTRLTKIIKLCLFFLSVCWPNHKSALIHLKGGSPYKIYNRIFVETSHSGGMLFAE